MWATRRHDPARTGSHDRGDGLSKGVGDGVRPVDLARTFDLLIRQGRARSSTPVIVPSGFLAVTRAGTNRPTWVAGPRRGRRWTMPGVDDRARPCAPPRVPLTPGRRVAHGRPPPWTTRRGDRRTDSPPDQATRCPHRPPPLRRCSSIQRRSARANPRQRCESLRRRGSVVDCPRSSVDTVVRCVRDQHRR